MEAIYSFDILNDFQVTKPRYIPEDTSILIFLNFLETASVV
jgi:hypothetical protein